MCSIALFKNNFTDIFMWETYFVSDEIKKF